MSQADEFWQYAEEVTLSAYQSKTEKEKQALLNLARTWSHAALKSGESKPFNNDAAAMAHADQLAAELGRVIRVSYEDGDEIYRTPETSHH